MPHFSSLNVAAVILFCPPAVSGLHGGGERGMVHRLCQHHLPGPGHIGGQDGEN